MTEHLMIKHKERSSKIVILEDGTEFNINTYKEEDLHAHTTRKMKNIMGTSTDNVEGYESHSKSAQNFIFVNLRV